VSIEKIKKAIRDVPDFPVKGIIFKDITPILSNPKLFSSALDVLAKKLKAAKVTKIAAIDARGFIFGGALADRLKIGFVPVRKQGKLPYKSYTESYKLEYGSATLTIHVDAFRKGEKVAIIDDLLATGGTAAATAKLVKKAGGKVAAILFLVELGFLNGRARLKGYDVFAPIVY